MRYIIKGYKVKSTDLQQVEDVLAEIQKKAIMRSKHFYAELLADEIEALVDDIALGVINRPADISIYDCAKKELDRRIAWASGNNTVTPYNFAIQAAIFTCRGESYIKLNMNNEAFAKEIKTIQNAEECSVTDDNSPNAEIWTEISQIYSENNPPMVKQLFPCGPIEVEWERIEKYFHSRDERAELRVRHKITNLLLNLFGSGQEIPNYKLLRYLDEAFMLLGTDTVKAEAERLKTSIAASIINISEKDVKRNPTCCEPTQEQ